MSPHDLAVYLVATLEEYAEVVTTVDTGTAAGVLDGLLSAARKEVAATFRAGGRLVYENGTSPVVEFGEGSRVFRWIRLPGDPTGPTTEQRAQLARMNLGVVK